MAIWQECTTSKGKHALGTSLFVSDIVMPCCGGITQSAMLSDMLLEFGTVQL